MSDKWTVTKEDVVTVLNLNGVDQSTFYDEDEWDDFVNECMGSVDETVVADATVDGITRQGKQSYANDSIEEQLILADKL